MSAYMIFIMTDIRDPDGLAAYRAALPKSMAGRGIKFLAGPDIAATLEGDAAPGAAMLEFPSRAAAEEWYHSPEYQQAAQHRYGATTCMVYLMDGRG